MSDDVTKNVQKFFHHYAEGFDSIYGHSATRGAFGRWVDRRFRQTMYSRFREVLGNTASPDIHSVLDVGCGSGRYIVEFLKQGKDVVGLDVAEGMLTVARNITANMRFDGKVEFVLSGYLEHRFDRRFDAACLMGFFDYIEKPTDIFEKLKRDVTKEIYASFPQSGGPLAWQRRVRYKLRKCPLWLYSRSDVLTIMERSGFVNNFQILDFGRDWFVKVDLRGATT